MLWGLAVACAAALALAAPSFAQNEPEFTVYPYVVGQGRVADTGLDLIMPTATAAPAKVVIYAAPGYTADLTAPAGKQVGVLNATIDAGGATLDVKDVAVTADDPAKYVTDARAQACAPGTHAAVWVMSLTLGTTTVNIPIFVDPTSGTETALGSYKLTVCFASPYVDPSVGGAPGHARLTEAELDFPAVFRNPSANGVYRWRALVTPYTSGTATADAAATYELRSLVQVPLRIVAHGRYDARHKQAVITGTFHAAPELGFPAKVIVEIVRTTAAGTKHLGHATAKKGKFTFRAKQSGVALYEAVIIGYAGACTGPASPAPAGCTRETVGPAFSNAVRVKATKPKRH